MVEKGPPNSFLAGKLVPPPPKRRRNLLEIRTVRLPRSARWVGVIRGSQKSLSGSSIRGTNDDFAVAGRNLFYDHLWPFLHCIGPMAPEGQIQAINSPNKYIHHHQHRYGLNACVPDAFPSSYTETETIASGWDLDSDKTHRTWFQDMMELRFLMSHRERIQTKW